MNTHLINGSSASGPGGHWEAIRHDALARDGFRCVECHSGEADAVLHVHHLLPRSMGGGDELGNLITLCAGCHAARHPKLSGQLARGLLERWASRLARWLDREGVICEDTRNFGPALRLFGLDRFRDGQLPIVEAALAGQSVLVVSPTGFGKTLCFQLPAVLRSNLSLVLSPLKALMAEQVSSLLRRKVPSTYVNSDLSTEEKDVRYRLVSKNGFKLLYVAPERFFVRSQTELAALHNLRPAFLVVDEAHCVDQWGRDFRPEYGRIGEIRRALGSPPVLAFTATAGMEMQRRILTSLGVPNATVFVRGVNRPNIALLRWKAPIASRGEVITQICRAIPSSAGKMMIFVPTVKVGTALQKELAEKGHDVPFYHSKQGTAWEREQIVKRFVGESEPKIDRIICTNAFGMGLDVPDVRIVVHWQQPASVEDYVQEFGRAGRDRKPSVAILLCGDEPREQSLLRFMADQGVKSADLDSNLANDVLADRHGQIRRMARLVAQPSCFRQAIVSHFEAPASSRPSFATRVLEWVFADRKRHVRANICCDACEAKLIEQRGQAEFVRKALGLSAAETLRSTT